MHRWISLLWFLVAGCFQTYNDEDELRVVPVTNNPHVVPEHGGGFPMMGNQTGPY
jgi:hypothetical protein